MKRLSLILVIGFAMSLAGFAQAKKSASHDEMKKPDAKAGMAKKADTEVWTPDKLQWGPAPAMLPAGAQLAVLEGNPMAAGPFTMRLKMPDGYKIPPHWHPGVEHVTLLQGEMHFGMGEKWDESKMNKLAVGTFAHMAPHTPHFASSKGESIIQLHGTGPWSIHYVNPADDPSKKK